MRGTGRLVFAATLLQSVGGAYPWYGEDDRAARPPTKPAAVS
jgi:hypothetical protein